MINQIPDDSSESSNNERALENIKLYLSLVFGKIAETQVWRSAATQSFFFLLACIPLSFLVLVFYTHVLPSFQIFAKVKSFIGTYFSQSSIDLIFRYFSSLQENFLIANVVAISSFVILALLFLIELQASFKTIFEGSELGQSGGESQLINLLFVLIVVI